MCFFCQIHFNNDLFVNTMFTSKHLGRFYHKESSSNFVIVTRWSVFVSSMIKHNWHPTGLKKLHMDQGIFIFKETCKLTQLLSNVSYNGLLQYLAIIAISNWSYVLQLQKTPLLNRLHTCILRLQQSATCQIHNRRSVISSQGPN